MARRALLIGSEIVGLTGVGRDLDIMSSLLAKRDFEIRRHEKDTATRDAIGAALTDLAADTGADDTVVVYYSGHGGRAQSSGDPGGGIPQVLQFIAPYDYEQSTADDFRGVTALEMSVYVAALTERTRNVAVLLDCCYSARMARDVDLVPRALPRAAFVDVAAHLDRVGIDRLARGLARNVDSNPDAVRLVAAGPEQQAFEYPGPAGVQVGLFTEGLRRLLDAAGDAPLTWTDLARGLRRWVQVIAPGQRPEAEGPAGRVLFTTDVDNRDGVLSVDAAPGGAILGAGRLAGVGPGDVYAAFDPAHPDLPVARLTVRSAAATSAAADVQLAAGVAALPAGTQAHPLVRAGRRLAVVVDGTGPLAESVRAAMVASRHVEPVTEVPDDVPVLATVNVAGDGAAVRDVAGPVLEPEPDAVVLVRNLDRLARAATIRTLEPGDATVGAALAVEWGRVDGAATPGLPESGATVFTGDGVWVRIRNTGRTRMFVFVFSVDGGGRIGLVTAADPSGLALDRDEEWVVGHRPELGATTGLPVNWPTGVSDAVPCSESLLVIATSLRQDLRVLEQEGVVGRRSGDETALEELLTQISDGGSRGVSAEQDDVVRYVVRHIEYLLEPASRPPSG